MRWYRILLLKAWFDKGLNLTNYMKYVVLLFGITANNAKATVIFALIYALSCPIIGFFWYKFKLVETENEINNQYNPFQREVRARLRRRKI